MRKTIQTQTILKRLTLGWANPRTFHGGRSPLLTVLASVLLLSASLAPVGAQGVTSPASNQKFCSGQTMPIAWQVPNNVGSFNPLGIRLKRQSQSSFDLLITPAPSPTLNTFHWQVPSTVASASDYFIAIPYQDQGEIPFTSGILKSARFEIGCEISVDPGEALARALAELEELLFHESVIRQGGRVPPTGPECTSCPYRVETRKLQSALREVPKLSFSLRVVDKRGTVVADLGRFTSGSSSYSGSLIDTKASRPLAQGKQCSFLLEAIDRRGKKLAKTPVCVTTGR